jgi:hypothetical protein
MDKDRLYGNCHCGTVQLSIPRNIDMSAVRRCDCSLCKRRGAMNKFPIFFISHYLVPLHYC